jgi:hypothetical protein
MPFAWNSRHKGIGIHGIGSRPADIRGGMIGEREMLRAGSPSLRLRSEVDLGATVLKRLDVQRESQRIDRVAAALNRCLLVCRDRVEAQCYALPMSVWLRSTSIRCELSESNRPITS